MGGFHKFSRDYRTDDGTLSSGGGTVTVTYKQAIAANSFSPDYVQIINKSTSNKLEVYFNGQSSKVIKIDPAKGFEEDRLKIDSVTITNNSGVSIDYLLYARGTEGVQ